MTRQLQQDIMQWDIRSWSRALKYWEKNVDWSKVDNALELGANLGGLSLWLALKGKHVVCSNLSDTRSKAEPLHKQYNLEGLIHYADIDAAEIPFEDHFDLVVFKSIIGGIGRDSNYAQQQTVFQQIYKSLKPGGQLLFAENLLASPMHQRLRKKFVKWGDSWRYITMEELPQLLKDFKHVDIRTTGITATFGRNEFQRNLLATLDGAILEHISPEKWKYIVYGIARK
jgi:SAM-dependent methyltransferase